MLAPKNFEVVESRNDLLLKDGIELLPEDSIDRFRIDLDDQIHVDSYNFAFDQTFITGKHVVSVQLENAERWLQEVNLDEKLVLLSRTEYDSGVVTRSVIFPHHHAVVSTIERSDGSFGETHNLDKVEDRFFEIDIAPFTRSDHFAVRHVNNDLQQAIAA